jgi:beclin
LYDSATQRDASPLHKRSIPAPQNDAYNEDDGISKPDMSFIEISKSQVVKSDQSSDMTKQSQGTTSRLVNAPADGRAMDNEVLKHEKIFSILSSHSDIDHPICTECTSLLLQAFTSRLAAANKERDAYAGFLRSLQQAASTLPDEAAAEEELKKLQQEDEDTYAELLKLEADKAALENELAELEEENKQLELEEEEFWASRNAHEREVHDLNIDLLSLQQKYDHDQKQLEKLQRTNVFNDTFCIGHDGLFATINGLRLGRLPGQNVEWAEINAAWGQTLLLLATVAERLGYVFKGYRLRPLGSTSRIEKIEYPQQAPPQNNAGGDARTKAPEAKTTPLDLFSSGDTALGRVFNHRKFDTGMVAFLECLSQLGAHVEQVAAGGDQPANNATTRSPRKTNLTKPAMPYQIQGDKIGDMPIKLGVGFSQDENFTKACKYVLTCCKYLLAYCSNLESR